MVTKLYDFSVALSYTYTMKLYLLCVRSRIFPRNVLDKSSNFTDILSKNETNPSKLVSSASQSLLQFSFIKHR